ncbi:MAG: hypothetical protein MZV64_34815 [Ignavibacteriales bacterium]|nr:hypothetical protein [Ignavibacteriales bacterium]
MGRAVRQVAVVRRPRHRRGPAARRDSSSGCWSPRADLDPAGHGHGRPRRGPGRRASSGAASPPCRSPVFADLPETGVVARRTTNSSALPVASGSRPAGARSGCAYGTVAAAHDQGAAVRAPPSSRTNSAAWLAGTQSAGGSSSAGPS